MQRVQSKALGRQQVWMAISAIAVIAMAPPVLGQATKKTAAPAATVPASTLDRIRTTGSLKLGFRTEARPFSYRDESSNPAGYSVELCQAIAESVKSELNLPGLKVEWVAVTMENRLRALQQSEIDVLCGAETVTLERRKEVSFSTPVFPGGVSALVRTDAPARLKEILSGRAPTARPNWRASAIQVLRQQTFSVVTGTTAAQWLEQRRAELKVDSKTSPVESYAAGVQAVHDRRANALFGERAILLDAVRRHPSAKNLMVIDRLFTFEPLALAVGRGDDDFRLLVDKTLSRVYHSGEFGTRYTKWFGEPDEAALTFYRWNALPN